MPYQATFSMFYLYNLLTPQNTYDNIPILNEETK